MCEKKYFLKFQFSNLMYFKVGHIEQGCGTFPGISNMANQYGIVSQSFFLWGPFDTDKNWTDCWEVKTIYPDPLNAKL